MPLADYEKPMLTQDVANIFGYCEGYYGKLLSWGERHRILSMMRAQGMNTYLYAPKADPMHRINWRQPYDENWCEFFSSFCSTARKSGIAVWASIAPGLDFHYKDIHGGPDFNALVGKCRQFFSNGADQIVLALDDIEPTEGDRLEGWHSEGAAMATLVNRLSQAMDKTICAVPRAYDNELHEKSPDYLPSFQATLEREVPVILCGTHTIAQSPRTDDIKKVMPDWHLPVVLWDNLYANDYCPRRLFVGPYIGRRSEDPILLNPTGMINTDLLLLEIVGRTRAGQTPKDAWTDSLQVHGVPDSFHAVAHAFSIPVFSTDKTDHPLDLPLSAEIDEALDELLWYWTTPLAREWYPYLYMYLQDRRLASGACLPGRIRKTYTVAMSDYLQGISTI